MKARLTVTISKENYQRTIPARLDSIWFRCFQRRKFSNDIFESKSALRIFFKNPHNTSCFNKICNKLIFQLYWLCMCALPPTPLFCSIYIGWFSESLNAILTAHILSTRKNIVQLWFKFVQWLQIRRFLKKS